MSKVIVTGGAGFIGSNLVNRLVKDGHNVTVIDDESSDAHESFYYNDKAEYWDYDIADYKRIEPLFKDVDYVFHLAAEARIQPAIEDPMKAVQTKKAVTKAGRIKTTRTKTTRTKTTRTKTARTEIARTND